jgi:putative phosphoesterase
MIVPAKSIDVVRTLSVSSPQLSVSRPRRPDEGSRAPPERRRASDRRGVGSSSLNACRSDLSAAELDARDPPTVGSVPAMVLVAVISDTHMPRGARRLPDACVERLGAADAILHAGDFMTLAVLEELQALGPPVHAVQGNVDSHDLTTRLPLEVTVQFEEVRVGMIHDAGPRQGRLQRMRRRFPDTQAVVFGHSHIPLHEGQDGFQIFNPGSPTERRRSPRHTMGLARIDGRRLTFELLALD